jgi:regulator of sigma E protease
VSTILYVLLALVVLGVCIFVHELGHYLAARACGLTVLEFAIGMGPKIAAWRKNDIDYSIRAFPVGGFCAFAGESPDDEPDDPRNINLQPAWKRLTMTLAGPLMNFILALLLAVVLMAAVGEYALVNRIDTVTENSPAAMAGIQPGDAIVGVDGARFDAAEEISQAIAETGERDVALTIERGGAELDLTVAKQYDEESGRYLMGVTFGTQRVRMGFFKAVGNSVSYCAELFRTMIQTLGSMFTQKDVLDQVAGPVGTVSMMTEYTKQSFAQSFADGMTMVINLAVIISMNLGLMNLLPLPALDGGRVVLLAVETVSGKHLSRKHEAIVHFVGLIVLMGLIVVLTGRDILRIFGVNV